MTAGALTLAAAAAGAALTWKALHSSDARPRVRLSMDVRPAEEMNAGGLSSSYGTPAGSFPAMAWTPDGRTLVFVGRRAGVQQIYLRPLDAVAARPLPNTEGAQLPAVSPDGQWVAFWARGAIRKVPLTGGPATELVPGLRFPPWGMCWDSRGTLFYSSRNIWMLPSGGKPVSITTRGDGERVHALPSLLPGNQVLVFTIRRGWFCWGDEDVVAYSLATKTRTRLLTNAADARYVSTGHLLFMRLGVLYAVRFDPERLAVEGPETPVSEDIAQALASWNADDATGADQYGDTFRDILVGSIDGGKARLAPLLRSTYSEEYPEFSPDGHWLIYASDVSGRRELYVRPWAGQGPAIPVSVGGGSQPAWHPNGREIFFVGPTDTPGRTRMLAVGFTPGTPPRVDRGFDD